jgi:aryl-alcohol dehydrogenase-like predicted oxidoreductase
MHWPERVMNMFGKIQKIDANWQDSILKFLPFFDGLIKEGKIKQIGFSNESVWHVI